MKQLKIKLGDDQVYTLRSLPFAKVQAIGKKSQGDDKMKRFQELTEKESAEAEDGKDAGLSIEEMAELKGLSKYAEEHEDETVEEMVRAIRLSLAPNHPKFAFCEDKTANKSLDEEIKNLMDMQDITATFQFAMTGTIPKQEEIEIPENVIDLTN